MRRRDAAAKRAGSPTPASASSSRTLSPRRGIRRLPSGEKVEDIQAKVRVSELGKAKLVAVSSVLYSTRTRSDALRQPGTPFDEVDLSQTFLRQEPDKVASKKLFGKRRIFFVLGGVLVSLSLCPSCTAKS
jgi:hypothetical protein